MLKKLFFIDTYKKIFPFNKYFSHPKFLSMIEEKFGAIVIEHINSMLKIKIKRKHRDPITKS